MKPACGAGVAMLGLLMADPPLAGPAGSLYTITITSAMPRARRYHDHLCVIGLRQRYAICGRIRSRGQ